VKIKYTKKVGAIIFSSFLAFSQLSFAQNKAKQNYEDRENEREKSEEILERAKFELKRVRDIETGKVPERAYWNALIQTKQAKEFYANTNAKISALTWTERGPNSDVVGGSNGNSRPNSGVTSGRVRAIQVDAADATGKTVWIGGVDGGLWKTTDITLSPANWTLVNDYLSNLAVTDICQDPANSNNLYFCTGESYGNLDAVAGAGVFKSIDHGATWALLASTSSFTSCTRILCDYQGNVYLATGGNGLQRSTDGGSTWTNITPSGMSTSICDLEISSTSVAGRLHVVGGIFSTQSYRYTDALLL
jgi:trimeric autotransporter adhesin